MIGQGHVYRGVASRLLLTLVHEHVETERFTCPASLSYVLFHVPVVKGLDRTLPL